MSAILSNGSHSWKPVGMAEQTLQVLADPLSFITLTAGVAYTYGIAMYIFLSCVVILAKGLSTGTHRVWTITSMIFASVTIATATIYCVMDTWINKIIYVDDRYLAFLYGTWPMDNPFYEKLASISETTSFVANWMNGGLIVYRLWDLFGAGSSSSICISGFALIVYLVIVAMGMMSLYEIPLFAQQQSFWLIMAADFVEMHYVLMTSYAALATSAIMTRVVYLRIWRTSEPNRKRDAPFYLNVIYTSLIESSALYTIWIIAFFALYSRSHPIQIVFLGTMPEIQAVASLATIYNLAIEKDCQNPSFLKEGSSGQVAETFSRAVVDISNKRRIGDQLPPKEAPDDSTLH